MKRRRDEAATKKTITFDLETCPAHSYKQFFPVVPIVRPEDDDMTATAKVLTKSPARKWADSPWIVWDTHVAELAASTKAIDIKTEMIKAMQRMHPTPSFHAYMMGDYFDMPKWHGIDRAAAGEDVCVDGKWYYEIGRIQDEVIMVERKPDHVVTIGGETYHVDNKLNEKVDRYMRGEVKRDQINAYRETAKRKADKYFE